MSLNFEQGHLQNGKQYSQQNGLPTMSNQANWFFIEVLKNNNLKSMAHTKCQVKCTNSQYKIDTYKVHKIPKCSTVNLGNKELFGHRKIVP